MEKVKFAVIDTWPWGVKNAESEVINRMKVAAENIGAELVCITKEGFVVDDNFQKTEEKIDASTLDFVLSMHYEDIKMQDAFHYHTLWNPPKITLQYPLYHLYSKNIASHDDYLIYDDGGMSDHLKTILSGNPRNLNEASSLTASFSKSSVIEPEILENPTLFYCGMNWERFIGEEARYKGLFALLDKQKDVNLYGPEHSWDGYKRYRGSIPFDGTSLIQEIHKCGVVLALSSDYHYLAGAATNRIYEACAGGAVTISDTNRFIMKNFGDSVLYIDFDKKHPDKMFAQICAHLNWIKRHPAEALEKAKKAQRILVEKFSLEKQLSEIIANHELRKKQVEKALYAQNSAAKTLAVLFLDVNAITGNEIEILTRELNNVEIQRTSNITLVICCDERVKSDVNKYIADAGCNVVIRSFDFFDDFSNKVLSRGQAFSQIASEIPHEYIMLLDGSEIMFSDHVTRLMRVFEDDTSVNIAYSGDFLDAIDGVRYPLLRQSIYKSDLYACYYPSFYPHTAGMFLMKSDVECLFLAEMRRYLDNCLPNALLNLAVFKNCSKMKYSGVMTVGKVQSVNIDFAKILTTSEQINFVQGLFQTEYEEWLASVPQSSGSGNICFAGSDHIFKQLQKRLKWHLRGAILVNKIRLCLPLKKVKREATKRKIEKWAAELKQIGG